MVAPAYNPSTWEDRERKLPPVNSEFKASLSCRNRHHLKKKKDISTEDAT